MDKKRFAFSFAGGGANFLAHLEVITAIKKAIKEEGELKEVEVTRVSGTSAGSIAAAVMALDLDVDCVKQAIRNQEKTFKDLYSFNQVLKSVNQVVKPFYLIVLVLLFMASLVYIVTYFEGVAVTYIDAQTKDVSWINDYDKPNLIDKVLYYLSALLLLAVVIRLFIWVGLKSAQFKWAVGLLVLFVISILVWQANLNANSLMTLLGDDPFMYASLIAMVLSCLGVVCIFRNLTSILRAKTFGGDLEGLLQKVLNESIELTKKKEKSDGKEPCIRPLLILATNLNDGTAVEKEFKEKELQSIRDRPKIEGRELIKCLCVSSGIPFVFRSLKQAFHNGDKFSNADGDRFLVDGGFAENLPVGSVIGTSTGNEPEGIIAVEFPQRFPNLNVFRKGTDESAGKLEGKLLGNSFRAMLEALFRAQTSLVEHLPHVSGVIRIPSKFIVGSLDFESAYRIYAAKEKPLPSDPNVSELREQVVDDLKRIVELGYSPSKGAKGKRHQIDPIGRDYGWRDGLFSHDAIVGGKIRQQERTALHWMTRARATYEMLTKEGWEVQSRSMLIDFDFTDEADKTDPKKVLRNVRKVKIYSRTKFSRSSSVNSSEQQTSPVVAFEVDVAGHYPSIGVTRNCWVELLFEDGQRDSIFFPSGAELQGLSEDDSGGRLQGTLIFSAEETENRFVVVGLQEIRAKQKLDIYKNGISNLRMRLRSGKGEHTPVYVGIYKDSNWAAKRVGPQRPSSSSDQEGDDQRGPTPRGSKTGKFFWELDIESEGRSPASKNLRGDDETDAIEEFSFGNTKKLDEESVRKYDLFKITPLPGQDEVDVTFNIRRREIVQ